MARLKTNEEFVEELKQKQPHITLLAKYVNNTVKLPFKCNIDNFEWDSLPTQTLKCGCKVCNGAWKTTETFIKEAKEKNKKVKVIGEYKGAYKKILCKCLICGEEYYTTPTCILQGNGHNACSMKESGLKHRRTHEDFCDLIKKKYDNEYTVLGQYTKASNKILMKHHCGYEWEVVADSILTGHSGCPKCSGVYRMDNYEYIEKLKNINPTIVPLEEFKGIDKKILHKCTVCNHEWKVIPASLVNYKRGCPICKGGTNTVIVGLNDMWTTNPELAKLLSNSNDGYKYMQGSNSKVSWKCPDCGKISKPMVISKVKSRGFFCKACSQTRSLPNRIMYNLLSDMDIKFQDELSFEWCRFKLNGKNRKGIYDFYFELNDNKYIVEMDGYFHANNNTMNGQTTKTSQKIDFIKDKLAEEHGIKVIRIECIPSTTEIIKKNILTSDLYKILDLTKVNWNKCFYNSASPIIKDVCKDFNNGICISDLERNYNKDFGTIQKFLLYGNKIGLCHYTCDGNRRKIVCLNDSKIFQSISKASKFYNIPECSIQKCCSQNKENVYAGRKLENDYPIPYIFKYYEDYTKMSDLEILQYIQKATFERHKNNIVICTTTNTIFPNTIYAKEWCGSSITGNLYNPSLVSYSGKHPITNEKLKWLKYNDYLKSTASSEGSF
ncbi:zinc-ribbon domain-containing protein [Acetatifactor muris]|uniref:Treble clef zinc finger domain-containing protein n=1 Tax=Acetatifactor muris TaxID=879566 RepID=A0A2K4ZQN4_9FIRM|nr:zinc-ribbon domain-containing protein [Acetatifactor muris]MCR2051133.1 zinc-ribbon domain-containing protein [Acetatifactor muris]SOY32776.1 hypothetical protein AMURIS_05544 [Acetatifactor muris]